MQLSVRGRNDILTKKEVRTITYAFGEKLLGQKLFKNITVTIRYDNPLSLTEWGYCNPIDEENRFHREFEIVLNPHICRMNQIKTLAHELSHVKQFSRGLLRQKYNTSFKWMGKILDSNDYDYSKIPWEKDAIRCENELYAWYKYNLKKDIDSHHQT